MTRFMPHEIVLSYTYMYRFVTEPSCCEYCSDEYFYFRSLLPFFTISYSVAIQLIDLKK